MEGLVLWVMRPQLRSSKKKWIRSNQEDFINLTSTQPFKKHVLWFPWLSIWGCMSIRLDSLLIVDKINYLNQS